nr:uncharacterized protein LOC112039084 [Quercus suber]
MWCANLDALPTRVNLMKRKVVTDPTCQVCGIEQESTLHALWSCPKLNEVWAMHFGSLRSKARKCSTFLEVFRMCMEKSHATDMFAILASQIWFRRNKLRLVEEVADLKLLNSMTRDALQEFQHANITAPKPPPAQSHTKWMPPPTDWVKVNFDGAVFQESGEAGLGTIIHNDHGLVMATLTQVIPLLTLVEMVEVLAAQRALIFAKELGFDHVILEGESKIAVQAMKREGYSATSFGYIFSNIKVLSTHFKCLVFWHTRRQGNKVAHSLAQSACNFSPFCTWIEEVPVVSSVDYLAEIINNM